MRIILNMLSNWCRKTELILRTASTAQLGALLAFMEKYKNLSLGNATDDEQEKLKAEKIWSEITDVLNQIPGVVGTVERWKITWRCVDFKTWIKFQNLGWKNMIENEGPTRNLSTAEGTQHIIGSVVKQPHAPLKTTIFSSPFTQYPFHKPTATVSGTTFDFTSSQPTSSLFSTNQSFSSQPGASGGFAISVFGQPASSSGFGNIWQTTPAAPNFSIQFNRGTSITPYQPTWEKDTIIKDGRSEKLRTKIHSISAMNVYLNMSLEELRLEDYFSNRKGQQDTLNSFAKPSVATSPFGQTATPFGKSVITNTILSSNYTPNFQPIKNNTNLGSSEFKYEPTFSTDTTLNNGRTQNVDTKINDITAMKVYETKSLEELRMEDYLAKRNVPQTTDFCFRVPPKTQKLNVFGQTTTQPTNSLFSESVGDGTLGQLAVPTDSNFGISVFGQPINSVSFGSTIAKYQPTIGTDTILICGRNENVQTKMNIISAMKEYETKSLEELRMEYYMANQVTADLDFTFTVKSRGLFEFGRTTTQPVHCFSAFEQDTPMSTPNPLSSHGDGIFRSTVQSKTVLFGQEAVGNTTKNVGHSTACVNHQSIFKGQPRYLRKVLSKNGRATTTCAGSNSSSLCNSGMASKPNSGPLGYLFRSIDATNTSAGKFSSNSSSFFGSGMSSKPSSGPFGDLFRSIDAKNSAFECVDFKTSTLESLSRTSEKESQQNTSIHQEILSKITTPYGDNPIFRNLKEDESGELNKATSPLSRNSILQSSNINVSPFKVAGKSSSCLVKVKPIGCAFNMKSLFEDLEALDNDVESFNLKPNSKNSENCVSSESDVKTPSMEYESAGRSTIYTSNANLLLDSSDSQTSLPTNNLEKNQEDDLNVSVITSKIMHNSLENINNQSPKDEMPISTEKSSSSVHQSSLSTNNLEKVQEDDLNISVNISKTMPNSLVNISDQSAKAEISISTENNSSIPPTGETLCSHNRPQSDDSSCETMVSISGNISTDKAIVQTNINKTTDPFGASCCTSLKPPNNLEKVQVRILNESPKSSDDSINQSPKTQVTLSTERINSTPLTGEPFPSQYSPQNHANSSENGMPIFGEIITDKNDVDGDTSNNINDSLNPSENHISTKNTNPTPLAGEPHLLQNSSHSRQDTSENMASISRKTDDVIVQTTNADGDTSKNINDPTNARSGASCTLSNTWENMLRDAFNSGHESLKPTRTELGNNSQNRTTENESPQSQIPDDMAKDVKLADTSAGEETKMINSNIPLDANREESKMNVDVDVELSLNNALTGWEIIETLESCKTSSISPPSKTEIEIGSSTSENPKGNKNPEETGHAAGIILKRKGYYTIPSMEDLKSYLTNDGTCVVPNFEIGRAGYGKVFFDQELDVAGLNLDEIVYFRNKEIIIYPDDAKRPPIGQGLNRVAQVTLYQVWPLDRSVKEPIKDPQRLFDMGWVNKLQMICEENDHQFIGYNLETGTWIFRVKNFSQHGLT